MLQVVNTSTYLHNYILLLLQHIFFSHIIWVPTIFAVTLSGTCRCLYLYGIKQVKHCLVWSLHTNKPAKLQKCIMYCSVYIVLLLKRRQITEFNANLTLSTILSLAPLKDTNPRNPSWKILHGKSNSHWKHWWGRPIWTIQSVLKIIIPINYTNRNELCDKLGVSPCGF